MARIFIIDDEEPVLEMIERALEKEDHKIYSFSSPQEAIHKITKINPDVVITDIKMDELNGFDVLHKVKKISPEVNVILITAYASVDTAVEALRSGAFDYLIKPFKINELRLAVKRALSEKKITSGVHTPSFSHKEIVGKSNKIQVVKDLIKRVSKTDSTVLIYGESGTGKELVAQAIHACSGRVRKPFVSINCAALPDTLLESELFGYEKGSFTGAINRKVGLVEYAEGGSLFLDEVGETSLNIQVKLLRTLQEKEIKRVGGLKDITVDVRTIAATSRNLEEEVKRGTFREDLFYRLNVIPIFVPALKERREDIGLLITHFVSVYNEKMQKNLNFTPDAFHAFHQYDWPGNVRELENCIERIFTLSEDKTITKEMVEHYWGKSIIARDTNSNPLPSPLRRETASIERELIIQSLRETKGNKTKAAKRLNISKQNLQYYLKKFKLM